MMEFVYEYGNNPSSEKDVSNGNVTRRLLEAFSTFSYKEGIEKVSLNSSVLNLISNPQLREYFQYSIGCYVFTLTELCHDVQVVVVDRLAQFFGHRLVDFIGVHNRRHEVLLAVNLTAETVSFLVELPGIFVAAVLLKVPCVHINDQLIEDGCTGFLPSCGDFALVNEPLEILVVRQTAGVLEVNIAGNLLGVHLEICVVRDKIPEIIESSGKQCKVSTLDRDTYIFMLDEKLNEELNEYQESKSLEELADLLEVIMAVALARGNSFEEIESIRVGKALKRGRFEKRILAGLV